MADLTTKWPVEQSTCVSAADIFHYERLKIRVLLYLIFSASKSLWAGLLNFFLFANQSFCTMKDKARVTSLKGHIAYIHYYPGLGSVIVFLNVLKAASYDHESRIHRIKGKGSNTVKHF